MVTLSPQLAVAVVALVVIATVAVAVAGLDLRRAVLTASARATVQLVVVSAVLVAVFGSAWLTAAYLSVMFVVASATAARRLGLSLRRPWAAAPIAAGTVPVVALVLGSGAVPWVPQSVVPVTGIVLGGAMTATSLAALRMADTLRGRVGEYEAALALGLPAPDAVWEVSRPSAGLALVPGLDQTRTVGLVTLPGAFVGVLLGGGSAAQAGAAQLLVLVGLLAAQGLAVLVVIRLVGHRRLLPADLLGRLPT